VSAWSAVQDSDLASTADQIVRRHPEGLSRFVLNVALESERKKGSFEMIEMQGVIRPPRPK